MGFHSIPSNLLTFLEKSLGSSLNSVISGFVDLKYSLYLKKEDKEILKVLFSDLNLYLYYEKTLNTVKLMATITVKINSNSFVKLDVENDEYRFVDGTEENMIISAAGDVLKRYPRSYRYGGRREYYQYVHPKQNVAGYLQVNVPIRNTTTLVHRLVAETFLSNPKGYNEIDHRNHNKLDNSVTNLRWCTHTGNMHNSHKPKVKIFWKDITAVSLDTDEVYEFSRFKDITSLATLKGWGRGWGTAIRRKLDQNGGTAYGFYWSAKNREIVNIR